jgi:DNA-binding SARP family transcriptional activator
MAAQRLIAFLALHDHPLQRAWVAGNLWFATNDCHAQASLRSALWRVRCCGQTPVDATRTELRLAQGITIDVRDQIDLARELLKPSFTLGELDYKSALEGELLPGWYDDWVLFERERLRQLRMHALEALADKLRRQARYGEAVEAAFAALRWDPLRESTYQSLIRTHLAEGNRAEALRQYRLCCHRLHSRLGVEPSPEMQRLVRTLHPLECAKR